MFETLEILWIVCAVQMAINIIFLVVFLKHYHLSPTHVAVNEYKENAQKAVDKYKKDAEQWLYNFAEGLMGRVENRVQKEIRNQLARETPKTDQEIHDEIEQQLKDTSFRTGLARIM